MCGSPPPGWQTCNEVELTLGVVTHRGYTADLRGTVLCGASPARHRHRLTIRRRHLHWAKRMALCPIAVAERLRLWELWTDCAGDLDAEVACIVSDYCLLYTVLDDAAESYFGGPGSGSAAAALGDFVAVLDGRPATGGAEAAAFPRYVPIVACLADLRTRILKHARSGGYDLFVAGVDRYRRGVLQQIYMSQHGLVVSRETQLYNRLLNVAFDPTVVLLCLLSGIELGGEFDANPMMERLHMAVCRIGAVINDIISFPKEAAEAEQDTGQYHNLVAAHFNELARIPGIANPLAVSIARTFDFHNAEFRDFVQIGSLTVESRPGMERYFQLGLDMHRSWMNWCLTADRYRQAVRSAPTIQAERPVRLVLPRLALV